MSTFEAAPAPPRVGLVLGAGGVLGAAWLTGALVALEEAAGWDATTARHIVGTSAGSLVGTVIAAGYPPNLLAGFQRGTALPELDPIEHQDAGLFRLAPRLFRPVLGSPELALRCMLQPWRFPPTAVAASLMGTGPFTTAQIGTIVRQVAPSGWPMQRRLWIVAVDYRTGARVVFARTGSPRASLHRAVQASCAIPGFYRPVNIGGREYVDGGAWSPSNADLLVREDVDVVVGLNPMSSLHPGVPTTLLERAERVVRSLSGRRLGRELRRLREAGKTVLAIQPEAEDLAAMGVNLMNPARRTLVLDTAIVTTRRRLREPDAAPALEVLRGASNVHAG